MSEEKDKKYNRGSKLVGDIGEAIVSYELFKRGWEPTKNLLDGYDILIVKGHKVKKIEVKTRSFKRGERRPITVTKNEMITSDFIICHLYPSDWFLIVNVKDIPKDEKTGRGRFSIYINQQGEINSEKYNNGLNNWELLER
jgi:hypothetical protein